MTSSIRSAAMIFARKGVPVARVPEISAGDPGWVWVELQIPATPDRARPETVAGVHVADPQPETRSSFNGTDIPTDLTYGIREVDLHLVRVDAGDLRALVPYQLCGAMEILEQLLIAIHDRGTQDSMSWPLKKLSTD